MLIRGQAAKVCKKRVIEERKGPFAILPKMVTTIDKRKNSVRIQIVYAGF